MNNDRLKFRTPWYLGDKFAGFQYWDFEHGQVKLIGDYWEPWVSKRDKLTPRNDEQCSEQRDKDGNLIYAGDIIYSDSLCDEYYGQTCKGLVVWYQPESKFTIMPIVKGEVKITNLHCTNLYDEFSDDYEIIGNIHKTRLK